MKDEGALAKMDLEKIKDSFGDILIVEDEIINIKYLTEILVKEGYQIRPAMDANIALRTIEAKIPDLILMDIKLPDISGIELVRKIKTQESTKNIPIIFISSIVETNLKVEALESGGVDYITKPFQTRELLERIKIQLKISRMQLKLETQANDLKKEIEIRKQFEVKSQQYNRIIEDSLNEIYLFKTDTLTFVQANKAAQTNLEYTMEELLEMTPIDIKPDFTLESFEKKIEPLKNGKIKQLVFETIHKRKNKTLYNTEVHLQLIKINEEEFFSAIILDITDRKKIELELNDNRKLLNFTQELTKVGGWKYKVKEQEMFWTDEMYLIHDIDINDIKDGSTNYIEMGIKCYAEKDRLAIMEAFEKCCTQGIPYDRVFPFTTLKNKRIWIRTSAQAIKVDEEIVSVIGNIMDITEAKNSEIELSKYRNHLEKLVKERTEKLEKQNAELEHFNELFVDREFRIKELRDRVKELEEKGI